MRPRWTTLRATLPALGRTDADASVTSVLRPLLRGAGGARTGSGAGTRPRGVRRGGWGGAATKERLVSEWWRVRALGCRDGRRDAGGGQPGDRRRQGVHHGQAHLRAVAHAVRDRPAVHAHQANRQGAGTRGARRGWAVGASRGMQRARVLERSAIHPPLARSAAAAAPGGQGVPRAATFRSVCGRGERHRAGAALCRARRHDAVGAPWRCGIHGWLPQRGAMSATRRKSSIRGAGSHEAQPGARCFQLCRHARGRSSRRAALATRPRSCCAPGAIR